MLNVERRRHECLVALVMTKIACSSAHTRSHALTGAHTRSPALTGAHCQRSESDSSDSEEWNGDRNGDRKLVVTSDRNPPTEIYHELLKIMPVGMAIILAVPP